MDESELEGSLVLEKLAEIGMVEDFLLAIDSDNIAKAEQLMKRAKVDAETIGVVLRKMYGFDSED